MNLSCRTSWIHTLVPSSGPVSSWRLPHVWALALVEPLLPFSFLSIFIDLKAYGQKHWLESFLMDPLPLTHGLSEISWIVYLYFILLLAFWHQQEISMLFFMVKFPVRTFRRLMLQESIVKQASHRDCPEFDFLWLFLIVWPLSPSCILGRYSTSFYHLDSLLTFQKAQELNFLWGA